MHTHTYTHTHTHTLCSNSPVHTDKDVGEELIQEESSELKLDEELVEEDSGDSEEEGPMFLDLGALQQNKASKVSGPGHSEMVWAHLFPRV